MWFEAVYSATDPDRSKGLRFYVLSVCTVPQRLIRSSQQHFAVVNQSYADGTVRVTTIERTLVDVLAEPDYGGSWDEIYQSLTRADSINIATVAAYCQMRDGGAALRAKVGFFMS